MNPNKIYVSGYPTKELYLLDRAQLPEPPDVTPESKHSLALSTTGAIHAETATSTGQKRSRKENASPENKRQEVLLTNYHRRRLALAKQPPRARERRKTHVVKSILPWCLLPRKRPISYPRQFWNHRLLESQILLLR